MQKLSTPDEFKFPFEPYSIQLDFMRQLYETVEAGQVGIFESPTGTGDLYFWKIFLKSLIIGKSLSIICSALHWLNDHRNRKVIVKETKSESVDPDDWIQAWKDKQLPKKESKTTNTTAKKRKRKRPDDINDEIRKLMRIAKGDEKTSTGPDAEFLLEDFDSADSDDSDSNETFVEKVYYASRTHSQLSQFVQELKQSPYSGNVTIAPIASRASLCVNAKVNSLPTVPQMNEACKQLNSKD